MIIIRDGKEIELTPEELMGAYYECQLKWDMAFIEDMAENIFESENDDYVELAKRIENDPEYKKRVAISYRKYADEYPSGDTEWDCVIDALEKEGREE